MPPILSGFRTVVGGTLFVAALSMTACGAGTAPENETAKDRASVGGTTRESTSVDLVACNTTEPSVLQQHARRYARDEDIPVEEARRRLILHHCFVDDVADLERELRNKEENTFGGLYGQGYGYVVLFIRDGEETIRPYLKDEPEQLRRLVEVRSSADATAAELEAAHDEAMRILDRLKILQAASGTNVKKNRVEVYAKNKARFEAALREADARLPEHVVVVESESCCLKPG